jgi:hypothetical protein
MKKSETRKLEKIYSETLFTLRECYENMNAPIFTLLSGLAYEHEMEQRRKLIELCGKIAREYGER